MTEIIDTDDGLEEGGAARERVSAPEPPERRPPARHLVRVQPGGPAAVAPAWAFRAATIVNRSAHAIWASPNANEAEVGRDGNGGTAILVPPGTALTEPISGRELYLAADGSGAETAVMVYRWAAPRRFDLVRITGPAESVIATQMIGTGTTPAADVTDRPLVSVRVVAAAGTGSAIFRVQVAGEEGGAFFEAARRIPGGGAYSTGDLTVAAGAEALYHLDPNDHVRQVRLTVTTNSLSAGLRAVVLAQ